MIWTKEKLEASVRRIGFEFDEESPHHWTIGYSFENIWYTVVDLDMHMPVLLNTLTHEEHIIELMDEAPHFDDILFSKLMRVVYGLIIKYEEERQL